MRPLLNARRGEGQTPDPPKFYSVAEAARMFRTSQMTLYRAIADGQFPAVRIRGRLIIPAKAVDAMIEAAFDQQRAVDAAEFVPKGAA
ncbi:helix-turn-helix domain-containing protein [Saccharopolyspora sp. K220]|uniref:helix-turn-helix domain-containing protein n=1 Tax=Saccharopolyspora soli TaxID=2926618 RepID=UPI001F59713D|nr:helix-turn-helix domain-containing protein [Saccharopolyspora soli]MCI2421530.1 helix-turn-helix domain-containing protein [Saccharopolyspora soli]